MLYVGAVLHNRVVKAVFAASAAPRGQRLVPEPFVLAAEDPAAVILAFKNENAFFAYHHKVYLGGFAPARRDIYVEKEQGPPLFKAPEVFVCKVLAVYAFIAFYL